MEIHDGNSETADLLGKHCSNIAPAPIISSGPSLHIKFVSDYAHQGAGFSLRYEIFKTGKWIFVAPPVIVQEFEAVYLYYSLYIANVTHPHPTMNFLGPLAAFNSLWTDLYVICMHASTSLLLSYTANSM